MLLSKTVHIFLFFSWTVSLQFIQMYQIQYLPHVLDMISSFIPKPVFIQLWVLIFLSDPVGVVYSHAVSSSSPISYLPTPPHPMSSLLKASLVLAGLHFSISH